MKVKQKIYELVEKNDVEINIPDQPIYYSNFNGRELIGIFPVIIKEEDVESYIDSKAGDVSSLTIVRLIVGRSITKTNMLVDKSSIENMLTELNLKKSGNDSLKDEILRYLRDYYLEDRITKERFDSDYEYTCIKFNEIIL